MVKVGEIPDRLSLTEKNPFSLVRSGAAGFRDWRGNDVMLAAISGCYGSAEGLPRCGALRLR